MAIFLFERKSMEENISNHINNSLNFVKKIFERASEILESVKPGQTLTMTKLSSRLAEEFGMQDLQIYNLLKIFSNDYPGFEYRRGSKGGFYRSVSSEDNSKKLENE